MADAQRMAGNYFRSVHSYTNFFQSVVVHATLLNGNHGGKRLHLKRIGTSWMSNDSDHANAPQGDLLWVIDSFGEKTARFFGFELVSDEDFYAPNSAEIDGASAKINACPEMQDDPITAGFYDLPPDLSTPGAREYVTRHGRENRNPKAVWGITAVHDLTFHVGKIFVPKELDDVATAYSRTVVDFVGYLEKREAEVLARTGLQDWEFKLLRHSLFISRLRQIDNGTANFTFYLNLHYKHPWDLYRQDISAKNNGNVFNQYTNNALAYLTLGARSQREFLEAFYDSAEEELYTVDFQWFLRKKTWSQKWWWWFNLRKNVKQYLNKVRPIFEEYLAAQGEGFSKLLWTLMTPDQLCEKIHLKRINIMKAVERLTSTTQQHSTVPVR